MWQAMQGKDWTNFERRLSPTFVGVNADGQVFDRAGWLAYWKSIQVKEFLLGDVSVLPEGADMKVTYVLHFQGATAAPASGLRLVSVWQQIKANWMLTATAITPIQH